MAQRSLPPNPTNVVATLVKSATLLGALRSGPRYKSELADELGVSKSTVYNWACELGNYGLLERTTEGYCLTTLGRMHARLFEDVCERSTRLFEAEPLLSDLDAECLPPVEAIVSAEFICSEQNPDYPMNEFLGQIREAARIECLLPVAHTRFLDTLSALADSGAFTGELVCESSVLEYICTQFADRSQALFDADGTAIYQTDQRLPFGLTILDGECVTVAVYTDRGHLAGFILIEAEDGLQWAHSVYDEYRRGAMRVDSHSSPTSR